MKVGQYTYMMRGSFWRIYVCTHHNPENGSCAHSPVDGEKEYTNMEDARKRVFELNGWTYRGPLKKTS